MDVGRVVRLTAAGALVVGLLTGCAANSGRGATLYSEGRYIEAAEVFERTEDRIGSATDRERLQYSLYRGLTFVALGDYARARDWLRVAYRIRDAHPSLLDDGQHRMLDEAWRTAKSAPARAPATRSTLARVGH